MGKLLDSLTNYIDNTTPEQLEKDLKELEVYNEIGPTVDEYIDFVAQCKGYKNSDDMFMILHESDYLRKQTTSDV